MTLQDQNQRWIKTSKIFECLTRYTSGWGGSVFWNTEMWDVRQAKWFARIKYGRGQSWKVLVRVFERFHMHALNETNLAVRFVTSPPHMFTHTGWKKKTKNITNHWKLTCHVVKSEVSKGFLSKLNFHVWFQKNPTRPGRWTAGTWVIRPLERKIIFPNHHVQVPAVNLRGWKSFPVLSFKVYPFRRIRILVTWMWQSWWFPDSLKGSPFCKEGVKIWET